MSAFFGVRRRGLDMTRRSQVVLVEDVDVEGEGEGGQSVASEGSELVEPERERMYGKKRRTGVDYNITCE